MGEAERLGAHIRAFIRRQLRFWLRGGLYGLLAFASLTTGCGANPARETPTPVSVTRDQTLTAPEVPQPPAQEVTPIPSPTALPAPIITETANPTSTTQICPPLTGYSLERLKAAVSNPFNPPRRGSDDPHQGVDFSEVQHGIALPGGSVQSAMVGTVAMLNRDRFPYGNAVLIETSLDRLPEDWQRDFSVPTNAPTPAVRSALTCPELERPPYPPDGGLSLYLLYAHLEQIQPLEVDQAIQCGEPIGKIGQSGNALNPHLHFEARVGPGLTRFSSMAHYSTNASPEEMRNYCLWRVSGAFQLIDPLRVLENLP